MQPPVGADLRPKSRPAGGWPPKGGLRAALPTSARRRNRDMGCGFAGGRRKGWSSPPVHSASPCTPWVIDVDFCRGGYYPPETRVLAETGRLIAAPTKVFVSKKVGGEFDVRRAGVVPPYGDYPQAVSQVARRGRRALRFQRRTIASVAAAGAEVKALTESSREFAPKEADAA